MKTATACQKHRRQALPGAGKSSYNSQPDSDTEITMKARRNDDLPLFAVVDLSFIFHDVTAKPYNSDRAAVRLLNQMMDKNNHLVVELPIQIMRATQPRVNKDFAEAARRHAPKCPHHLPAVVKYQGLYYVADGHHRIVARHAEGYSEASVRLFDLDGDTQTYMPLLDFLAS